MYSNKCRVSLSRKPFVVCTEYIQNVQHYQTNYNFHINEQIVHFFKMFNQLVILYSVLSFQLVSG